MELENSRINEIIQIINDMDRDDFKSYVASPLLKELIELVQKNYDYEHDNKKPSESDLEDFYDVYLFIGNIYKRIGRFSLAAIYHEKALDVALELYCAYNKKAKDVEMLLNDILVERNYYVDDDCYDVLDKLRGTYLIEPEVIKKIDDRVMMRRRSLKHDPVEMSEEYLAVIDEVEERIDKNMTFRGMGSCHEIWSLKQQYLFEKGIKWKSPSMLNPRVMFD